MITIHANNYRIHFDLYCMYFYIHSIWMILNKQPISNSHLRLSEI